MTLTVERDASVFRVTRIFRDMEFAASEMRQETTTQTDSRAAILVSLETGRSQRQTPSQVLDQHVW
jgi:hypothetical protein